VTYGLRLAIYEWRKPVSDGLSALGRWRCAAQYESCQETPSTQPIDSAAVHEKGVC